MTTKDTFLLPIGVVITLIALACGATLFVVSIGSKAASAEDLKGVEVRVLDIEKTVPVIQEKITKIDEMNADLKVLSRKVDTLLIDRGYNPLTIEQNIKPLATTTRR